MRRIAILNQKGGVGKTTTSVNLSAAMARLGKKVLLVDMDPQSHATISFGLIPGQQKMTAYSLMSGRASLDAVIQKARENLYMIPSNLNLAGAEAELASEIGRETVLKERLAPAKGFDYIFFDSPPSLGVLNINVLCAADEVFIPIQGEFLSLNGISLLVRTLELVQKRLNPKLQVTGVIACMHHPQRLPSREVVEEVERFFKGRLFRTKIRINVKLAEAPSKGKTIFEYDAASNGAQDYLQLAREVLGLPQAKTEAKAAPVPGPRTAPQRGATGRFLPKHPRPPRVVATRASNGRFMPKKTAGPESGSLRQAL